jgi:hypothetical protein
MKSLSTASNKNRKAKIVETHTNGAVTPTDVMILLDKFKVETGFFELVEFEFSEIYPLLLEDTEYSPRDLIGEPLWNDLTSLAQRQAIHCLRHLATLDDAPLIDVSCPCCSTTSFEIIS